MEITYILRLINKLIVLEEAMNKAQEHYDPSMLVGIIADPKTGKVLAMSSKPSFNPNKGILNTFK